MITSAGSGWTRLERGSKGPARYRRRYTPVDMYFFTAATVRSMSACVL
jgi:hypothetical protein